VQLIMKLLMLCITILFSSEEGKLELRVKLGPLYNVYIGNATGHYCIDLEKSAEVKGGQKISALSIHETRAAMACGINTSQMGRPTCFRNAVFNDKPVFIDGLWFSSCPPRGTVRCDYASTDRPRQVNLVFITRSVGQYIKLR
jgi:hypothetical protein